MYLDEHDKGMEHSEPIIGLLKRSRKITIEFYEKYNYSFFASKLNNFLCVSVFTCVFSQQTKVYFDGEKLKEKERQRERERKGKYKKKNIQLHIEARVFIILTLSLFG